MAPRAGGRAAKEGVMDTPDALVRIVQALAEDSALREWFESLAVFSARERSAEFHGVARRMTEQHPEIAHALALLAAPGMYEAVCQAVAELRPPE